MAQTVLLIVECLATFTIQIMADSTGIYLHSQFRTLNQLDHWHVPQLANVMQAFSRHGATMAMPFSAQVTTGLRGHT